ncbi:MAG: hypothetical protein EA364_05110 [Balneolaceae bacterium]|nr:MAG: hypothetical protein EA364_05110 [Balneolaceae bacterium]
MVVNTEQFDQYLTEPELRGMQILIGALVMGALMFALIVIAMLTGIVDVSGTVTVQIPFTTLAVVVIFATFAGLYASVVLHHRIIQSQFARTASVDTGTWQHTAGRQLNAIRTGYILQFSVIEGIAFLGLVFNMLAAMNGYGLDSWIVWTNFLPTILLILRIRTAFPTRERILELHRTYSRLN